MLHAVFDTNVLVSALLSTHDDAATVQVVVKLLAGEVTPLYSDDIFKEYWDVLHRPKFRFDPVVVDDLLSAVHMFGLQVDPTSTGVELPDMKNLPFYEVVMEKQDEGAYLITGNTKHFPQKRFIVMPAEFLEIILRES